MAKKPLCKIDECGKLSARRGYCQGHYKRLLKYGDPLKGGPATGAGIKFLTDLVANPPSECVEWPYHRMKNGYGVVGFRGTRTTAHRVSLWLYGGPPPFERADCLHAPFLCHNRSCVNPLHLRWGTRKQNMADAVAEGMTTRGEKNSAVKLKQKQVLRIKSMPHLSLDDANRLADEYSVSVAAIYDIKSGRTWGWLKQQAE